MKKQVKLHLRFPPTSSAGFLRKIKSNTVDEKIKQYYNNSVIEIAQAFIP